jgi:hypothetical protein
MTAANSFSEFPPKWTGSKWGKLLVAVNSEKKCLHPSFLAHAIIASSIALGAPLLYWISRSYISFLSSKWQICPEVLSSPAKMQAAAPSFGLSGQAPAAIHAETWPDLVPIRRSIDALSSSISVNQRDRLKDQLNQIRKAQSSSCEIGVYFFANRTAGHTVSTAAAIMALSSLAFLSKKGWEGTNNAVINIGVTSGLVLFSAWTFGLLYGQSVNYENQRTKFVLATNLLNSASSAIANRNVKNLVSSMEPATQAVGQDTELNSSDSMRVLIDSIDKRLAVINDLKFEGDSSFAESSATSLGQLLNQSRPPQPVSPR